ncbi:hypothetical protein ANN_20272 [Periplaneta americana]|uniref:Uncharacterized protein n=1 Tax=Periplaneta americana TaxID=6978 RepID=A0ABQ8SCK2_PERAM|nr:hypothetical protein ANN_20272 [Periplaneta americana]
MAGLCEGGNEPPDSFKTKFGVTIIRSHQEQQYRDSRHGSRRSEVAAALRLLKRLSDGCRRYTKMAESEFSPRGTKSEVIAND